MLKKTLNDYHNRAALICFASLISSSMISCVAIATQRGLDLGLNDDEIAFYDTLAAITAPSKAWAKTNSKLLLPT